MQESLLKTQAIYDITPFTMLDFPGKTACILWFAGCNMRCPYCYNPDIVLGKGKIDYAQAIGFIRSRKNLLDGVVFSGGEAALRKDIIPFAAAIKSGGFQIKLDTNGSRPEVVKEMAAQNLLDYVSLDFKALPDKYGGVTKTNLFQGFEETLDVLLYQGLPFEVRTTFHSSLLEKEDIVRMISYLEAKGYKGTYYLQNYVGDSDVLGNLALSSEKLVEVPLAAKINVEIRN